MKIGGIMEEGRGMGWRGQLRGCESKNNEKSLKNGNVKDDVMIYDVVMSVGVGLGPAASQRAKMTENRWNNGGGQRDGLEGAAQRV